ncbi:MAG: hypothetical protein ACFB2W_00960 [Leptolyngbyaceae cyanobacterium]
MQLNEFVQLPVLRPGEALKAIRNIPILRGWLSFYLFFEYWLGVILDKEYYIAQALWDGMGEG